MSDLRTLSKQSCNLTIDKVAKKISICTLSKWWLISHIWKCWSKYDYTAIEYSISENYIIVYSYKITLSISTSLRC